MKSWSTHYEGLEVHSHGPNPAIPEQLLSWGDKSKDSQGPHQSCTQPYCSSGCRITKPQLQILFSGAEGGSLKANLRMEGEQRAQGSTGPLTPFSLGREVLML